MYHRKSAKPCAAPLLGTPGTVRWCTIANTARCNDSDACGIVFTDLCQQYYIIGSRVWWWCSRRRGPKIIRAPSPTLMTPFHIMSHDIKFSLEQRSYSTPRFRRAVSTDYRHVQGDICGSLSGLVLWVPETYAAAGVFFDENIPQTSIKSTVEPHFLESFAIQYHKQTHRYQTVQSYITHYDFLENLPSSPRIQPALYSGRNKRRCFFWRTR